MTQPRESALTEPAEHAFAAREAPEADASSTRDSLFGGRVVFRQPKHGYRVNIDSVLLAQFAANGRSARCAVDLGAGVGVVGLLLWHLGAAARVVLVEKSSELVQLAEQNTRDAGAPIRAVRADVEERASLIELERSADLVVCNPPFYNLQRHQAAPDPGRAAARAGNVEPFVRAASELVNGDRARAVFAYPAAEVAELLQALSAQRFVAKRMRFVHPFAERPARLVLIEARRSRPGGLRVDPPLIEWLAAGQPSLELVSLTSPTDDRT